MHTANSTDKSTWHTVRFGDMAQHIGERVQPDEATVDRYVGLEHLDPESLKIRRWGSPDDVGATKLRFYPGDIIFGKRRFYQRKLAVADFEGICSAHAMVLRAKPDIILPEFLPFFMQGETFFERAMSISVGSLSPTINWSTLQRQEFALPPLDEQRRIAEVLTAVEETIRRHEDLQKALAFQLKVLRVHLFGKKNGNVAYNLAELCNNGKGIQIGPFGSQLHAHDYVEEGIPVVMPSNMVSDEVVTDEIARVNLQMASKLARHKVKAGDILLPRRGELDRRAYIHPEQEGWICGTGSIRIRVQDKSISRAVFHALSARHTVSWLERFAVGTTMPNLNSTIVSNIPVYLPKKREDIETAVNQLERILETQKAVEQKIIATQKLKGAILQEMLS